MDLVTAPFLVTTVNADLPILDEVFAWWEGILIETTFEEERTRTVFEIDGDAVFNKLFELIGLKLLGGSKWGECGKSE